MSRRLTHISLLTVFLLAGEVWAIGLGEIRLDSALNEPLRAEIALLSATSAELDGLTITLASHDTFARYGIERPFYLQDMQFQVVDGGADGSVVQIRSPAPVTEPFLTFLLEATWSSGRLLREYTVLLDPPTYAPPVVQQAPAITAPRRSAPSDSARIERRPEPVQESPPQTSPPPQAIPSVRLPDAEPKPLPPVDDTPYDTATSADYIVVRNETLWSITSRMRPDSRLTMNQTMLAIFEANPEAFGGNINILKAGAALRIPGADEIFQINRSDALIEVQRQHSAWDAASAVSVADTTTQPSLTLVPPDDEPLGIDYDDAAPFDEVSREEEIEQRISDLEATDVPDQHSMIEIRDNELAVLRQELANIRGEIYEPPIDDVADDMDETSRIDALFPDHDEILADDSDEVVADDDEVVVDEDAAEPAIPSDVIVTAPATDKGIVAQILDVVTGTWGIIGGALMLVAGGLFWFMRRDRDDDDSGPWAALDADEAGAEPISATGTMKIPVRDEAIVVVEQESDINPLMDPTVEVPVADLSEPVSAVDDVVAESGSLGSIEDTFSSETAVNLDQTDPIAEADFHMAYGLYDQAADLINGALESDATDKSLMSKLCEIYFVWGNRDAFIDAATKLNTAVGDAENADWDKIVIMGQQIAADHHLFAGAGVAGATKEVDLSFDAADDTGAAAALDMDFGADQGSDQESVDFLFEDSAADDAVDLSLDATAESATIEMQDFDKTAEMSAADIETGSATIEEQFAVFEGTSELPSLDESLAEVMSVSDQDADATGEIEVDSLEPTEVAGLDDPDATGRNELLEDLADVTGKNPEISMDDTGIRPGPDITDTSIGEGLDLDDLVPTREMQLATDETGRSPMLDAESEQDPIDVGIDQSLLDATGLTQVLSPDMAVETASDPGRELADSDATMLATDVGDSDAIDELPENAETMLAPLDDDEDFDFAKTEALPPDAFMDDQLLDETAEVAAVARTDVDLDLDDLTAALQVSEGGDTIQQPADDATVEQPRPVLPDETAAVPTMSLSADEMSDELQDARTMTEVGTKLDLARAYVDMGDPTGARGILEEVLHEGDKEQQQQAQKLLDSLPS